VAGSGIVSELFHLADLRHRDPAAVLRQAEELLDGHGGDPAVRAAAHWVIGLSLHELGDPCEALVHYRRAIRVAEQHAEGDTSALARASMAISLLSVGQAARADQAVAAAREVARGRVRGVVELLAGLVAQRTGRFDDALSTYRRALRLLRASGDRASLARLLVNRGTLRAYCGDLPGALRDLAEAEAVAQDLGLPVLVAMAAHNTGFAEGRRGSVPDALAAFSRAERAYGLLGDPRRLVAVLRVDRCEVLLDAGLHAEALAEAEAAHAALGATGDLSHLTEARLLLARARLAVGDHAGAAAEASAAADTFRQLGRLPWAALARYVALEAEVMEVEDEGVPPPDLLDRARAIAVELGAQGWRLEALHVRTFVGRIALALDQPDVARSELTAAAAARHRGTAAARARAWHATALLRLAEGDERGGRRAIRRGMEVVEEYRSTLGATELRAEAATHGSDLARLGLRLALRRADARGVLEWAERCRAGALRQTPVRPPEDPQLADELAELRRWHTAWREAALAGRSGRAAAAEVSRLEDAVRNRIRQSPSGGGAGSVGAGLDAMAASLGDRVIVELVALEGTLHAVSVAGGVFRLHELGPVAVIEDEARYLLFALRGLLSARGGGDGAVDVAASRLGALLVEPLDLPAGDLVLVPTGALHGLPWAALPSFAGRSVTVTPSIEIWQRRGTARTAPLAGDRVALVAGPDIPGGEREVEHLRGVYDGARVLVGRDADAASVLAAVGAADLVHLAAHGTFRGDSPMFSSLQLDDGPLTIYDLERLSSVPEVFVLPACDAATAAVRCGDELLGTATALLGLGARSVVAPVMPVPDRATADLMVALHQRLCAGAPPATALAGAAADVGSSGRPDDAVAAAAFVCVGRDDVRRRDGARA
jgi:hypothetical protein